VHVAFARTTLTVAAVAAILVGGGFALASTGGAHRAAATSTTYYGCVTGSTKTLEHVTTSAHTCPSGSSAVKWNQTGPQGAQGPQGPPGTPSAFDSLNWGTSTLTIDESPSFPGNTGQSGWIDETQNARTNDLIVNNTYTLEVRMLSSITVPESGAITVTYNPVVVSLTGTPTGIGVSCAPITNTAGQETCSFPNNNFAPIDPVLFQFKALLPDPNASVNVTATVGTSTSPGWAMAMASFPMEVTSS
jgi:hypothetical protein